MKKIQILTGFAVLTGAAFLAACGGVSIGDATGAGSGAKTKFACTSNLSKYSPETVMASNYISARTEFCKLKIPEAGTNDMSALLSERATCQNFTGCTAAP